MTRKQTWLTLCGALFAVALLTNSATAWPKGGNGGGGGGNGGGGNGGGDDPPPSYDLPPFAYVVDRIEVTGMGDYYDTNDFGVSAVSMRPNYVPSGPGSIATTHTEAAAGLVYPDGSVEYLDNLIDPVLPYDLSGAIRINNSGQVAIAGFEDAQGAFPYYHLFLLTPNPDAATDGFAYLTEFIPIPDWGSDWDVRIDWRSSQLNEAGGVLYFVTGTHLDGTEIREAYIRYADGGSELLPSLSNPYNEAYLQFNSFGTLRVAARVPQTAEPLDYLLLADRVTTLVPENLGAEFDGWVYLSDLAENEFSCGVQARKIGEVKVKGRREPVLKETPTSHDPAGNSLYFPIREEMDCHFNWLRMNNQLVSGEPVMAFDDYLSDTGATSGQGICLCYPGYDAAYLEELMDADNQLAYQDLLNIRSVQFNSDKTRMLTPMLNGAIDHGWAPSFFGELESVDNPTNESLHAGIFIISPVVP